MSVPTPMNMATPFVCEPAARPSVESYLYPGRPALIPASDVPSAHGPDHRRQTFAAYTLLRYTEKAGKS